MKGLSLALTVSLVCMAGSSGIGRAVAEDSTSPSPMDELGKLVGEGTCTGNLIAMGKSPGHATTGKYHSEKTLDGHWVVIHYDENKTDANPKPFHVQQYFSYDPEKKMFVAVAFDNSTPGYTPSTSAGWKGDTFTFDYSALIDGKTVLFRDVFTHDATQNTHTGMMRAKSGEWIKTDTETCKAS